MDPYQFIDWMVTMGSFGLMSGAAISVLKDWWL
jgi:hypothetical protein